MIGHVARIAEIGCYYKLIFQCFCSLCLLDYKTESRQWPLKEFICSMLCAEIHDFSQSV